MAIKIKKQLKIKLRYVFFILVGIWTVDFITTIIALNFFIGFSEANKCAAYLFNLGWYGWFISFFLTMSMLFLFTFILGYIGKSFKKLEEKKNVVGYYNLYLAFVTGIFVGFEILVIINNVSLLLGF